MTIKNRKFEKILDAFLKMRLKIENSKTLNINIS